MNGDANRPVRGLARVAPVLTFSSVLVAMAIGCATSNDDLRILGFDPGADAGPVSPTFTPSRTAEDASTSTENTCSACPALSFCEDGACRCPVNHATVCANVCVDLQSDNANCGACGHACGSTADGGTAAACLAGLCRNAETFPLSLSEARVLVSDGQSLYVLGRSNGGYAVERADKSQLPTFTRLVDLPWLNAAIEVTAAAVAGDYVYFGYGEGLFRLSKTSGDVEQISNEVVLSLAATATHLYVSGTSTFRMTLPDGPLELFLDFSANQLAVRGNDFYASRNTGLPPSPSDVIHVDIATRTTTVIGVTTRVTGLAALENGVIWSSGLYFAPPDAFGEHRLLSWTKSPPTLSVLHQNAHTPVTGVATDGQYAYFTNGYYFSFEEDTNTLAMLPLHPGDGNPPVSDDVRPVALSKVLQQITQLTPMPDGTRIVVEHMRAPLVDGGFVYWLDEVEPEYVAGNPEPVPGRTHVRRISIK